LTLLAWGLAAPSARAQYFGQSKVQYKTFPYQILKTEHFDIYFYPEEKQAVELAGRMAERWHARLSKLLGHQLRGRQPVILYACAPDFEQTNAIGGTLGEGTGGVTEPFKRRVVLPFAGSLAQTDHVLGHELVHAFQYDMTAGQGRGATAGFPGAVRLPLWFIEGMAEYFSIGPHDPNTAMWMRDALRQKKFPTVRDLENPRYFPYRYGQALLAYIGGRFGDVAIAKLLRRAGATGDVDKAIQEVLGVSQKALSEDWHHALLAAYEPLRARTTDPGAYGRLVVSSQREGGDLNVGPALSPDGKRMLFLSSKDLFSIDLFLADVGTGRVERKIVDTASNAHFDSIEFIDSAGAWSPTGDRFAFAAIRKGRPHLVVVDVDRSKVQREIPFPALGQIFNPTWSPDGREVAFTALVGGLTDLFIADLATGRLRRMTDDAHAELQPAWSPDGRRIAFVTDRFGSQLALLAPGRYRIGLLDVASGRIEEAPGFEEARNLNPQWSSDGSSLYFLSDRNGVMNVYRLDLARQRFFQVTDVYTGVSGITDLSPALSTASRSARLVFSAYEDGKYNLYEVQRPEVLAGQRPEAAVAQAGPSLLPPQDREQEELPKVLGNERLGLLDTKGFKTEPYRPRLGLDYVGQPTLVAGADAFGTYIGGSTALVFSDMMGEHNLTTAIDVNGTLKDIGGLAAYTNLRHRWNWGVIVERVPYRTGGFLSGLAEVGGEPALVEQDLTFRQTESALSGVLAYPFSRAQRLELRGAYRRIAFSEEVETTAFSLLDGRLLDDRKESLPAPSAINLGELSAALVYDNAAFGATSPILGQRYRFEVTPSVGALTVTNAIADYRRYFLPRRPFTIALRALHFGRYGRDADDPRLAPVYLGDPGLVRGYGLNSFDASECPTEVSQGCPVFDRLLGNRLLVGNLELRFPLLGAIRGGRSWYGPLPLELALFSDAGVPGRRG